MWLFTLLGQRLKPTWKYTSQGMIWRLVPTEFEQFVGEERNTKTKQLRFFCVARRTGEVAWKNKTYGEQWWMGIEAVHRDVLYLHRFATPDMPQHKGITAVDLFTGKELWSRTDLRFETVEHTTLVASMDSMNGAKTVNVHYRTGEPIDSAGVIDAVVQRQTKMSVENEMLFPAPQEVLSEPIAECCAHEERVGPVEVLEARDSVIFSYHRRAHRGEKDETKLDNVLYVLGKENGKVVYTDTLNTNVPGVVPESFFVYQDMLYYVKERTTLTAVRLMTQ